MDYSERTTYRQQNLSNDTMQIIYSLLNHIDSIFDNAPYVCCRYSRPAIKRGEVAGCPVREGKNSAQQLSNTGQSISSASLTNGCL